jgi:hypothetical protein
VAPHALAWTAAVTDDLLAIDPGVHDVATAWFEDGILRQVGFWAARKPSPCRAYGRAIVEIPQFDRRPSPQVIELAVAGAYLAGSAAETCRFVTPSEWKGSVPKPIHHCQIWTALSEAERACFPQDTNDRILAARMKGARDAWRKDGARYYGKGKGHEVHNLLDAAGLGLFELGRITR